MRTCTNCGVSFDPTTGKGYRCPPCRKVYDAAWREKRRAEGKPASGYQMPREYHQAYGKTYTQRPQVKERIRARSAESRNNPANRHKHEARWKVSNAVTSGRLVRQPCEVCGAHRSQAHHPDYSRPLDVKWLCAIHPRAEHTKAEGK